MVISLFSRQDSKKVLIPNISTSLLIYPNFDFRTILPNIFELGEKTGNSISQRIDNRQWQMRIHIKERCADVFPHPIIG